MKKPVFKIITVWPGSSWAICDTQTGAAIVYFAARVLAETYLYNLERGMI